MVLRIVLPPPDVAYCRWPSPHYWPDLDEHTQRWGLAAWEWMATWCPMSLAQIPDPVGYFTELDRLASAEEQRIHQALVRARVDHPDIRAEEAVEAEWVRIPKEVETPVWEPTWPDLVKVTIPHFRDYGDGTFAMAFVEERRGQYPQTRRRYPAVVGPRPRPPRQGRHPRRPRTDAGNPRQPAQHPVSASHLGPRRPATPDTAIPTTPATDNYTTIPHQPRNPPG